jgi:prepilin-type N-terminal cleavage/methylation domain-containing protein
VILMWVMESERQAGIETNGPKNGFLGGIAESRERFGGFTLIELLVVMSIISMLTAISLPVFTSVRDHVRSVCGIHNQKQIVLGVTLYTFDNEGQFPESVATVGFEPAWNWSEPTKLVGNEERSPGLHRAMSGYLYSYIKDAGVMFCPKAPKKYKYLQQSWDAGDQWDNPETPFPTDPVGGTYCFYWNYIGFLEERDYPFRGPCMTADDRRYSKLLVSDYLGYDHWRSPDAFISCEKLRSVTFVPESWLLSSFWTLQADSNDIGTLEISLNAGYTDGHVEQFETSDAVRMRVSLTPDGTIPYPEGVGPGYFYLPRNSLK